MSEVWTSTLTLLVAFAGGFVFLWREMNRRFNEFVGRNDERFTGLDSRFDRIDTRLDRLDVRIDQLLEVLRDHGERIARLER